MISEKGKKGTVHQFLLDSQMQNQINIAYILLITSSINFDAFLHRRKYDTAILFILKKTNIGIIFRNRVTQPRLATKLGASGKKMAANI